VTNAGSEQVHVTPAPEVSLATAARIAADAFGVEGLGRELPSERDRNVWIDAGDTAYVLKVSNSAEDPSVIDLENAAIGHVGRCDPELPIPVLLPSLHGQPTTSVIGDDGRRHLARLVSVLPGTPLEGTVLDQSLCAQVGAVTGRMSRALAGLYHPAAGRTHVWDVRGVRGLAPRIEHVAAADRKAMLTAALARIGPTLDGIDRLPGQIEHADVTLINVLAADGAVTGVIDFGDLHHTASVCDLAVALNSVLRSVAHDGWGAVRELSAAFLEGYQRYRSLTVAEADAIADLLLARTSVSLIVSAWRSGEHPDNTAYIGQYDAASWQLLELFSGRPDLTAEFAGLAGLRHARRPSGSGDGPLRARRDGVFAGSFSPLMYDDPVQLSHGEGPWLFDVEGRRLLDGYNNVPVVGHGNAVVARAVSEQLAILNTNARYLHRHGVALAERILATMPADSGFDTCILTNSGSEAVDLGWRLATAYTGGGGALVGDYAYHGITAATEAFSPNEWPADHRPRHVATFEAPYRPLGELPVAADEAVRRVDAGVAELAARGHAPALLLVDPLFTSSGILDADPAFLAALGDRVHEHGGLVLADEVQSGFGRVGPSMWAFVDGGLRPDIVTLGKPMGNGHPVAAVVTRREITAPMARRYAYFSTFAGSPVSAVAALATLDVISARRLAERAVDTGEHLRTELRRLAEETTWLGEVRGRGLIAGVEVVADPPAGVTANTVVERLRALGVLVGATGRGRRVLKIRPPLVWERTHADLLVSSLRRAVSDLSATAR